MTESVLRLSWGHLALGLAFLALVIGFWWWQRRLHFNYLEDFTSEARKVIEQAKHLASGENVSGLDLRGHQVAAAILFNLTSGQPQVTLGQVSVEQRAVLFEALKRGRPAWFRWFLGGPTTQPIYQRAGELAFAGLTAEDKKQIALAIKKNARWDNFGFVGVHHLFEAVCEKDCFVAGRLGLLGRALYPGWAWLTWLLQGRDCLAFTQLSIAVRNKYLEKPDEVSHQFSFLEKLGRNLTRMAQEGCLELLSGRDEEIQKLVRVLRRKRGKKSPIVKGEPGVGKTAIVRRMAQLMVEGKIKGFESVQIIEVRVADLIGKNRAELRQFVQEISKPNRIVFLDEIHLLWFDLLLANELKPLLLDSIDEGGIRIIGASTDGDLRRVENKDRALVERFEFVPIEEMTVPQTIQVLQETVSNYEIPHGCKFKPEAIEAAAILSMEIPGHCRPRTATDIMNAAAADYAGQLIEPEKIAEVVAIETGIAASYLYTQLGLRSDGLDYRAIAQNFFNQRLYGQEVATQGVLPQLVERYFIQMRPSDDLKPVSVVCAVGSTGNGKTESALLLAELIYRLKYQKALTPDQLERVALLSVRLNEFTERHSVSRMIGSPPGYVGYYEAGLLSTLREKPTIAVVLLDEIEKAAREVHVTLMNLMEKPIRDSRGLEIDPRRVIMFATSNIEIPEEVIIETAGDPDNRNDILKGYLATGLPPEVAGRFDEVIAYRKFDIQDARVILNDFMLPRVRKEWLKRCRGRISQIIFTEEAKRRALQRGFSEQFGVRQLRQAVRSVIEDEIARQFAAGGQVIRV